MQPNELTREQTPAMRWFVVPCGVEPPTFSIEVEVIPDDPRASTAMHLVIARDMDFVIASQIVDEHNRISDLEAELAEAKQKHVSDECLSDELIKERDEVQDAFDALVALIGVETEYSNLRGSAEIIEDCDSVLTELKAERDSELTLAVMRGEEIQALRKELLGYRFWIHKLEGHNQYFERCESTRCNSSPESVLNRIAPQLELPKLPPGYLETYLALESSDPEKWLAERDKRMRAEGAAQEMDMWAKGSEICTETPKEAAPAFRSRAAQIRQEAGLL